MVLYSLFLINISHSPSACDQSKPCQARVTIRCECGLHKQEVACLATSTEQSRGLKNLPCTDLCARTERNRKLAEALDIDTSAAPPGEPEDVKGGYQIRTLNYFNNNKSWCLEIEAMFREFLGGTTVRLAFKPMNGQKREFVHELAEAYGLESRSVDYEPYRRYFDSGIIVNDSVELFRNNRTAIPRYTLSEAAKLKDPNTLHTATLASSGLLQLRRPVAPAQYDTIPNLDIVASSSS
jgi:transcriptional repressor NF-X1